MDEPLPLHDDAAGELLRLREAIDRVDEVIRRLFKQRQHYAVEIGELEQLLGGPERFGLQEGRVPSAER